MNWWVILLIVAVYLAIGKLIAILFDSNDHFEDLVIVLIMWPVFLLIVGLMIADVFVSEAIHRKKRK